MPHTEDDLRAALRVATTDTPQVPDRVAQVQRRVRRDRRRRVVGVAGALAVVLLAMPLARTLPSRLGHSDQPVGPGAAAQMDAMMKVAAFVAWWDGSTFGGNLATQGPGVVGVTVTRTLPPFTCAVVTPAEGWPSGTQSAGVLGQGSVVPQDGQGATTSTTTVPWTPGITSCDPRPSATLLVDLPATEQASAFLGAPVALGQRLDDPSRPAIDVAAVYAQIPPSLVTDHGREVYQGYERELATVDFGTPREQTDRVLWALAMWVATARTYGLSPDASTGLRGPIDLYGGAYAGTASVPAGFSVRASGLVLISGVKPPAPYFCVDGSIGGAAVRHVASTDLGEPGTPVVPLDGPCGTP
jgi:hypothetical protein